MLVLADGYDAYAVAVRRRWLLRSTAGPLVAEEYDCARATALQFGAGGRRFIPWISRTMGRSREVVLSRCRPLPRRMECLSNAPQWLATWPAHEHCTLSNHVCVGQRSSPSSSGSTAGAADLGVTGLTGTRVGLGRGSSGSGSDRSRTSMASSLAGMVRASVSRWIESQADRRTDASVRQPTSRIELHRRRWLRLSVVRQGFRG